MLRAGYTKSRTLAFGAPGWNKHPDRYWGENEATHDHFSLSILFGRLIYSGRRRGGEGGGHVSVCLINPIWSASHAAIESNNLRYPPRFWGKRRCCDGERESEKWSNLIILGGIRLRPPISALAWRGKSLVLGFSMGPKQQLRNCRNIRITCHVASFIICYLTIITSELVELKAKSPLVR